MNKAFHALVIDDQKQARGFVAKVLSDEGWLVTEAESAEEAFVLLREQEWSAVFSDIVLGGANGFNVLHRFKQELPETSVVLMTGFGSAAGALDAAAFGAYDYLLKPFGVDELTSLSQAIRERHNGSPTRRLVAPGPGASPYQTDIELVGRSDTFIAIMKQVGRVAKTDLPVLLTGESGTGKEVVATALHKRSRRADKPFVTVNCGAIPSELIESELFGHVRGSFTGADRDRRGLWEEANGGTIFLDEITETSPGFQVKLLRALQESEIRRVGSNQTLRVDVRVIAASNRDVAQEVEAGRFRKDLFYRLNTVSIALPSLRERREDILPLAKSFAERVYSLSPPVTFSAEVLELLEQYPWPGNVRELENAVVHAVAMCDGTVRAQDLPEQVRKHAQKQSQEHYLAAELRDAHEKGHWPTLAEIEGWYVARVLTHTGRNKQAASRVLGVDRKTLDRMITRHNLSTEPTSADSR